MNKVVYLDNAATTPLDERVVSAMADTMNTDLGNPSAAHVLGRKAKAILESSRRSIASLINAEPKEIIFTSGGTEADNMTIQSAVRDLGVRHIITAVTEHKAVLYSAELMAKKYGATIHYVNLDPDGRPNYEHLEKLASDHQGALITLMHANNEIGTMIDLERVGDIAKKNDCLFHSDTVQTLGHFAVDVKKVGADFIACSAHKFNGPKGVGFLYLNSELSIDPMMVGGGQESGRRAGTENLVSIVGLTKAMEVAHQDMDEEIYYIRGLKHRMRQLLEESIPGVEFNGDLSDEGSLYTVLNVSLPPTDFNELLLQKLDMEGVCCSGGSACNSGANIGSHVLNALGHPTDRQAIRFSFSRFTSEEDVDYAVEKLKKVMEVPGNILA
jgi:cysteine desulfurase